MSARAVAAAAIGATLVTAVGGVARILLATGTLPDVLRPFVWSDVLFVYERGLSGHRLPYVDTPFEYPPLIGALSVLFSLVSPGPVTFVAAWVLVVALAAGGCAAVLAKATDAPRTWRYWVIAPQLLLLGTVNFDILPTALLTLAAVSQRSRRNVTAMVALALGTVAKLFPASSAPLAAARARRPLPIVAFVAVLGLFYVPTAMQPFSSAGGVGFYAVGIRSNIDSVWGVVERALTGIGVPNAGTVVLAITLVGLAATYVLLVLPRGMRAADPAIGFGLATIALLFWSRLYSPQYSLWLLPFFALLALPVRVFALLALADTGVFLTIYPLTLVERVPGDVAGTVLFGAMVAFVLLRHVALWSMWRSVGRASP
ncbi:MAG TPA: hypothetical protein VM052_00010 [Candidatus Limnocylindrales bacterium]|nr:hypothetical protein [Candidatus Limnocylindrales bacterium]